MNKKISAPLAISIVVLVAVIAGGFIIFQNKGYDINNKIIKNDNNKVNDVEKEKLIGIAKEYVLNSSEVYLDESEWIGWSNNKLGIELNRNWIIGHQPKIQYFPPDTHSKPYEYLNNKYTVDWFFIPGCEENPRSSNSPNWFDSNGYQCLGGYELRVLIDSNLKAEQILLYSID